MTVREPVLTTVVIMNLRPTQITVGMREVEAKRKRWRETSGKKGGKFLGSHMIPVVLGPKHRHYVVRTSSGASWTIAAGCIRSMSTAAAVIMTTFPKR